MNKPNEKTAKKSVQSNLISPTITGILTVKPQVSTRNFNALALRPSSYFLTTYTPKHTSPVVYHHFPQGYYVDEDHYRQNHVPCIEEKVDANIEADEEVVKLRNHLTVKYRGLKVDRTLAWECLYAVEAKIKGYLLDTLISRGSHHLIYTASLDQSFVPTTQANVAKLTDATKAVNKIAYIIIILYYRHNRMQLGCSREKTLSSEYHVKDTE